MGYAELLNICPYGKVYNESINLDYNDDKCQCPEGTTLNADGLCLDNSDICLIYSDLQKKCYQCKDDNVFLNKWLNEFDDECYFLCPPTTFGDPLMNQCRRCHETCYECNNETEHDCLSCTGELYYNEYNKTCIPN